MRFDSKCEFAPPTILLGLLLCPWTWGISQPLKCLPSYWDFSDPGCGVSPHGCCSWPWMWGISSRLLLLTLDVVRTTWPAFWEICMQIRKQQLELDMEQQTGSILEKEYIKYILSPCLFNFYAEYIMRNAGLGEAELESRLPGEISITSDMQITPPFWQKVKRN